MRFTSIRRLGRCFLPPMGTVLTIVTAITAGTSCPHASAQSNDARPKKVSSSQNKPKLFSTDEILGGLADQTELFAKLSVSSPYKEADSFLNVQDRSELATPDSTVAEFPKSYTWMTPGTLHHPLYFEQVNLERYGTGVHPVLQPALSAAHFFTTIPILPYKMGSQCPRSTEYTLGHYRPGDCTPHQWHHRPWSWRGAGVQALFVTGLVFAAP